MKKLIALVAVAAVAVLIAGCADAKPTQYNFGFVIGGGDNSARNVKQIVMPGELTHPGQDDDVQFVYSNARNFKVSLDPGSDIQGVWNAPSKPSADGATPGYNMQGQGIALFALNRPQNIKACSTDSDLSACKALFAFYQYCQKYGCTTDDTSNPEDQALSTDAGWEHMLREGLGNALKDAFTTVMATYSYTVANDPAKWPEIGAKMAKLVRDEMRQVIGLSGGLDVFCSTAVITSGQCDPITIKIQSITSPDAEKLLTQRRDQDNETSNQLAAITAQKTVADAQHALDANNAAATAALYAQPGYAQRAAADAIVAEIKACAGVAQCIVQLGGNSSTQLQVPAKQ